MHPRCLETATIAVVGGGVGLPLVSEPLLRERVVLSSEVGRPKSQLQEEFSQ